MIPLIEKVVKDWEKSLSLQKPALITQMTEVKSQAFICYSHQDSAFVDRLVQDLESRGIKPWLDKWEINEGIKRNDYLIIVLSKSSVK